MEGNEEFYCEHCEGQYDEDNSNVVEGISVCDHCFYEESATCHECGEYFFTENMKTPDNSSDLYCESCFAKTHSRCESCGCMVRDEVMHNVNGEDWCENCVDEYAVTCHDCEQMCHTEDARYVGWDGNTPVCEDCYCENYFTCEGCRDVYHSDDGYSNDYATYCESCFDNDSGGHIHDYSYKPNPYYFKLRPDESNHNVTRLYFGVETEVETTGNYSCRDLAEWLMCSDGCADIFYCKWDSSLDDGFEIVSHPFTWNWMLKNRSVFESLFDLRKRGARSYNTRTCGMHVHMSRRAFSHLQILKFVTMLYDYPLFTRTISRRTESSMNSYANVRKPEKPIELARTGRNAWDRGALNFMNGSTIECRIFRGTLNPVGWFSNMEFLQSLFVFCQSHGLPDITPTNYLDWVADRPKVYPNFLRVHMPRLSPEVTERIA
jgi:hypothetical protein